MNAIIFRYYHVNGALLDVLDYYLKSQQLRKGTNLFLIIKRGSFEDIERIIKDRYLFRFDYKHNLTILSSEYKLIYYKFNNVLIMDYGTTGVLPYTLANHYHLVYDHDERYILNYLKYIKRPNFTVYNEMPFGYGGYYKLKFPFDLYKPLEYPSKKYCYINASGKSKSELETALKLTKKKIMITGDPTIEETRRIKVYRKHPENFFSLWDTYMYIHDGKYFEPRCRLLMEAYYYKKNIIYHNTYRVKDGSWWRFKELVDQGLEDRHLTEDDELMEVL